MESGVMIVSRNQSAVRVGILGGGQLARMLAQAAIRQGLEPVVLVGSLADPAAISGAQYVLGSLNDMHAIEQVCKLANTITLENEFLDLDAIQRVLETQPHASLKPSLHGIAVAQDKLAQRRLLRRLGVAVADFEVIHSSTLEQDLTRLARSFPNGFVLKWSRFGYDGRGNLPVRLPSKTDLEQVDLEQVVGFCRRGEQVGATIYAERLIDFECELALVSVRAQHAQQVDFPLVTSRQERGVCREVIGPANALGYPAGLEQQARAISHAIAEALDLVGTLAVEFFLDKDGQLIVNELAPRVHNSGHFTLHENAPSQFDLHVQAVCGLPLSEPQVSGLAVMRNILGPWGTPMNAACRPPTEAPPDGSALTWYGKSQVSPGRKMGHLTGRASSLDAATALLTEMKDYERRYWDDVSSRLQLEVCA